MDRCLPRRNEYQDTPLTRNKKCSRFIAKFLLFFAIFLSAAEVLILVGERQKWKGFETRESIKLLTEMQEIQPNTRNQQKPLNQDNEGNEESKEGNQEEVKESKEGNQEALKESKEGNQEALKDTKEGNQEALNEEDTYKGSNEEDTNKGSNEESKAVKGEGEDTPISMVE